jgi:hypothetical protein
MTWKASGANYCGYCARTITATRSHGVSCPVGKCMRCRKAPMIGGGIRHCAPCYVEFGKERAAVVAARLAEMDGDGE